MMQWYKSIVINNLLHENIIGNRAFYCISSLRPTCTNPKERIRLYCRWPIWQTSNRGIFRFPMYFKDNLGPDSKNSYTILKSVMKTVDFGAKGIKFTYQMIPLQFHYYAFKIHQGIFNHNLAFLYVQNHADAVTTQKLVDYFFDRQDQFTE